MEGAKFAALHHSTGFGFCSHSNVTSLLCVASRRNGWSTCGKATIAPPFRCYDALLYLQSLELRQRGRCRTTVCTHSNPLQLKQSSKHQADRHCHAGQSFAESNCRVRRCRSSMCVRFCDLAQSVHARQQWALCKRGESGAGTQIYKSEAKCSWVRYTQHLQPK